MIVTKLMGANPASGYMIKTKLIYLNFWLGNIILESYATTNYEHSNQRIGSQ